MKSIPRIIILMLVLFGSACSNNIPVNTATSAPSKTPTPESTSTPSPEPTPAMTVYNSHLGVSFVHPDGWFVSESEGIISIASDNSVQIPQPGESLGQGEILMEIFIAPLDYQTSSSLLDVLGSYVNFLGVDMPDKEPAHIIELSGREFAIGTYSKDYMTTTAHGNRAPLFIATLFTEVNTLLLDMYAAPDNESKLREIFEDFLISIEALP
ncbi:MAG: hypothetical protein HY863_15010 [Chloroflexi bacterium]|nr:hypothetical protein [Chloroflexota bacterium]